MTIAHVPSLQDRISDALKSTGAAAPEARLLDIELSPIGIGAMADTYLVRFNWDEESSGPGTAVLKRPAQDSAAAATAASLGAYEREARFYTEMAPRSRVRAPRLLGALADGDGNSPDTILLEDLTEQYRPGDQLHETPLHQLEEAVRQLALMQAPFWNDEATGRQPWLHRRLGVPIPEILDRMERSWTLAATGLLVSLPAEERKCIDRFVRSAGSWAEAWDDPRTGPKSLVHHDFRVDNMLMSDDEVVIIDWQTVGWGPVMFDFAYLMGTSVEAQTRKTIERDMLRLYLSTLELYGVDWSESEAWEAYRRSAFAVLLMLVPPISSVKSNARMEKMYQRLLSLGARQVLDLDALEYLSP